MPRARISNVRDPTQFFTGREESLREVNQTFQTALKNGDSNPIDRTQLIYGDPGMGKSQFARKFCSLFLKEYPCQVWIDASTTKTIEYSFSEFNARIQAKTGSTSELSRTEIFDYLSDCLENESEAVIFIFDNALSMNPIDDYPGIKSLYPDFNSASRSVYLVTSTASKDSWHDSEYAIKSLQEMTPLSPVESVLLLARKYGFENLRSIRTSLLEKFYKLGDDLLAGFPSLFNLIGPPRSSTPTQDQAEIQVDSQIQTLKTIKKDMELNLPPSMHEDRNVMLERLFEARVASMRSYDANGPEAIGLLCTAVLASSDSAAERLTCKTLFKMYSGKELENKSTLIEPRGMENFVGPEEILLDHYLASLSEDNLFYELTNKVKTLTIDKYILKSEPICDKNNVVRVNLQDVFKAVGAFMSSDILEQSSTHRYQKFNLSAIRQAVKMDTVVFPDILQIYTSVRCCSYPDFVEMRKYIYEHYGEEIQNLNKDEGFKMLLQICDWFDCGSSNTSLNENNTEPGVLVPPKLEVIKQVVSSIVKNYKKENWYILICFRLLNAVELAGSHNKIFNKICEWFLRSITVTEDVYWLPSIIYSLCFILRNEQVSKTQRSNALVTLMSCDDSFKDPQIFSRMSCEALASLFKAMVKKRSKLRFRPDPWGKDLRNRLQTGIAVIFPFLYNLFNQQVAAPAEYDSFQILEYMMKAIDKEFTSNATFLKSIPNVATFLSENLKLPMANKKISHYIILPVIKIIDVAKRPDTDWFDKELNLWLLTYGKESFATFGKRKVERFIESRTKK